MHNLYITYRSTWTPQKHGLQKREDDRNDEKLKKCKEKSRYGNKCAGTHTSEKVKLNAWNEVKALLKSMFVS